MKNRQLALRLFASLFAIALYAGATAQSMTEVTSYEETLISKISNEYRTARFNARYGKSSESQHHFAGEPMGKRGLDIFPDTLYAGKPFDVHYGIPEECEATYDLFDHRGKRPKKMVSKFATHLVNGTTVMRVVIDEPGTYEIVAYDQSELHRFEKPDLAKSRWTFEVLPRRKQ